MRDVRFFFGDEDIDHMGTLGIDLATYEGVQDKASSIYVQTLQPNGRMPPDPARKWSAARSQTLLNWISTGMPRGVAEPQYLPAGTLEAATGRVRRNAADLSGAEIDKLKTCFSAMMAKDPTDPDSYFQVAAIHWFPPPTYCVHHDHRYNPWHRNYLERFEDAMRKVPGCDQITLPYWDILSNIPDFLLQPPFDKFVLQLDATAVFPAGYTTERYSPAEINANIAELGIAEWIKAALSEDIWETFNDNIISAHDNGHVSCGPTLEKQEVASFDPLFWFFHCNWDRLWWKWQIAAGAMDYTKFKATVKNAQNLIFFEPPLNIIKPFTATADAAVATADLIYIHPEGEPPVVFEPPMLASAAAGSEFALGAPGRVSVMVKGLNRMMIPGSFVVHLKADGTTVRKTAFFQPADPSTCESCKKRALTNFRFDVDRADLEGKALSVEVQVVDPARRISEFFPVARAGNPTINVRSLLTTD